MSGRDQLPSGLVTFMFTDIEGSTRLARMLGSGYHRVLAAHRTVLRQVLTACRGTEMFTEGDSFFVAFAEASAALAAGVAAQRALAAYDWPAVGAVPRVRMGLHTGWAQPVGREYASAEVHRAARVAAAAHGGQVLCSAATVRHAGDLPGDVDLIDLGAHRLRGFDDRERLYQLAAPGLPRVFPHPRTLGAPRHNLPAQLTSFVGRRDEVREVIERLRDHRLVTVAGAGGVGKTRLALAVAEGLVDAYPDGVWYVDCAGVTDPAGVPAAAAAALGLRAEPGRPVLDTVVEWAATRRTLVVLDTCEAQPAAAAAVALRVLGCSPSATVLAVGRQPLAVHGELVWRVAALPVRPAAGGGPSDAVALLADRAASARGGRACTVAEMGDLQRVASQLEGLPLAIELAAARLRLLPAARLADDLDGRTGDPLAVLDADRPASTGDPVAQDRQRSLAASVEWSYRTLGRVAAGLLRRLAVYAGPVDLATVQWCAGVDAVEALTALVDRSLLDLVPGPVEPRYRMSGPVRGYVVRLLTDEGAAGPARDHHVAWCLHALHRVRVDTDGQPRTLSLRALAPYIDEWRAGLRWAATGGDVRAGLRLAGVLDPWWREHGDDEEAREVLPRLFGRLSDSGAHVGPAELAASYLVHAEHVPDLDARVRLLHAAESSARRADDPALLVRALAGHRVPLVRSGRLAEAERLCRSVIDRAERTGVPDAALPAVIGLGELLWRRGALDEAAELLGGARPVEAGHSRDRGRRTVDMLLGMVALRRGDLIAAHDHLVVALRSRMRHGFLGAAADTVAAIAVRCALGGDPATAATLFGAVQSRTWARRGEVFGDFWAVQQAALRARVGDAAFDAAYAGGARLNLDQAVAVALAVEHPDLEVGSIRFGADAPTLH